VVQPVQVGVAEQRGWSVEAAIAVHAYSGLHLAEFRTELASTLALVVGIG